MKAVTLARLVYKRFVQKDDEAALYLLNKVGKTLIPGYRFVFPQLAWWFDAPLNELLFIMGATVADAVAPGAQ